MSFFVHIVFSLLSTSSFSVVLTIGGSEYELPIKSKSNYTIVPGWDRGGRPIFALSLLFFSNTDSPLSMIGADAVLTVQLNGTGRSERDMILPDFEGEELDI